MATQTTNYKFTKDDENEYYDIAKVNANLDKIDTELKRVENKSDTTIFQTAGGTATAITLSGTDLTDGYSRTFIVKASNNGSATTINGKPLYKPGTTVAPKLIAGKAVTVWYSTASSCFFIKASASGNTVPSHVLASDTFSTDDDTDLVGTMPNNGAETTATFKKLITNLLQSADFLSTNGWSGSNAGISLSSGSLAVTGTGTSQYTLGVHTSIATQSVSKKYYLRAKAKVSTSCLQIILQAYSGSTTVNANVVSNPVNGTEYTMSGLIDVIMGSGNNVAVSFKYSDAATANGKVSYIRQPVCICLTDIFGAGNEPTVSEMDALMDAFGGYLVKNGILTNIPNGAYINNGITGLPDVAFVDTNHLSKNIKSGITLLGVTGDSAVVDTSDADAVVGNVLSGKKFYVNGTKLTGSMTNNTGLMLEKTYSTPNVGSLQMHIPSGYYDTTAWITASDANFSSANIKSGITMFGVAGKSSVVDTADANAVSSQILSGKSAYINGAKITGSMPNKSGADNPASSYATYGGQNIYVVPTEGYYPASGASTVISDANFIAANIKKDVSLFGLVGSMPSGISGVSGSAYATDEQITFYNNADHGNQGYGIQNQRYISVSGLTAKPRMIYIQSDDYPALVGRTTIYKYNPSGWADYTIAILWGNSASYFADNSQGNSYTNAYVNASGFRMPVAYSGNYSWYAIY